MSDEFLPGRHLGAGALNRLAKTADSAHLGFAGFLASDNGFEQVARNPRRPPGGSAGPRLVPADVCPAVVHGNLGGGLYSVWLYPNGIGGPGRSAATVCLTERGVENDLPAGTIVLAHAIVIAAAEDGDDGE